MNTTDLVLKTLAWMWANPWSIILALAAIIALALWARRVRSPDYFYVRGLRRCNVCHDGSRTKNKVIYDSKATASTAALRYQRRYGQQWPYRAPCGYWHLTSQNPATPRPRASKR